MCVCLCEQEGKRQRGNKLERARVLEREREKRQCVAFGIRDDNVVSLERVDEEIDELENTSIPRLVSQDLSQFRSFSISLSLSFPLLSSSYTCCPCYTSAVAFIVVYS